MHSKKKRKSRNNSVKKIKPEKTYQSNFISIEKELASFKKI